MNIKFPEHDSTQMSTFNSVR